jgi:hypothetical protein
MRIATCVRPLTLNLLGNQSSVAISEGWEGDLDQVIGKTDRGPVTVADALGHHLTPLNFREVAPSKKGPAPAATAKPQTEE